jgi:hypothetical protein
LARIRSNIALGLFGLATILALECGAGRRILDHARQEILPLFEQFVSEIHNISSIFSD